MGLPLGLVWKFQLVSKAAARLLAGTDYHQHVTLLLKSLHSLPICYWAKFQFLVLIYNALNNLGLECIKDHLIPYIPITKVYGTVTDSGPQGKKTELVSSRSYVAQYCGPHSREFPPS